MRPLTPTIALPGAALASTAFCTALRQVVQAAQSRHDWMPRLGRTIPGAVEERHATLQTPGAAPRGVLSAVMSRHDFRQQPDPTHDRLRGLQHEISQCQTDASVPGATEGAGTAQASWNTQYAAVGLRRADGGRESMDPVGQLSIASRW